MSRRLGSAPIETTDSLGVPRDFLTEIAPRITDIAELQVSLAYLRLAAEAGSWDVPVPEAAILQDAALRRAVRRDGSPREPDYRIRTGLELAVGRGTLLRLSSEDGGQAWYLLHTVGNRAQLDAMARGATPLPPAVAMAAVTPAARGERPTVFRLYEQNIGLLTPLIADQIVQAIETFPIEWIEEAIGEAATYNRRSWRYIQRILENWAVNGRPSTDGTVGYETHRRRDQGTTLDSDRYGSGKHLDRARER